MSFALDFLKRFGWPFAIFSGAYFLLGDRIPARSIALSDAIKSWLLALSVLIVLIELLLERQKAPKVRAIEVETLLPSEPTVLLRPSSQIGPLMAASLFWVEGKRERFVGAGIVNIVQENGLIQLSISFAAGAEEEMRTAFRDEPNAARKRLIVRPGVPLDSAMIEGRVSV